MCHEENMGMAYGPNMLKYPFSDITITVWIYDDLWEKLPGELDSP